MLRSVFKSVNVTFDRFPTYVEEANRRSGQLAPGTLADDPEVSLDARGFRTASDWADHVAHRRVVARPGWSSVRLPVR